MSGEQVKRSFLAQRDGWIHARRTQRRDERAHHRRRRDDLRDADTPGRARAIRPPSAVPRNVEAIEPIEQLEGSRRDDGVPARECVTPTESAVPGAEGLRRRTARAPGDAAPRGW